MSYFFPSKSSHMNFTQLVSFFFFFPFVIVISRFCLFCCVHRAVAINHRIETCWQSLLHYDEDFIKNQALNVNDIVLYLDSSNGWTDWFLRHLWLGHISLPLPALLQTEAGMRSWHFHFGKAKKWWGGWNMLASQDDRGKRSRLRRNDFISHRSRLPTNE